MLCIKILRNQRGKSGEDGLIMFPIVWKYIDASFFSFLWRVSSKALGESENQTGLLREVGVGEEQSGGGRLYTVC